MIPAVCLQPLSATNLQGVANFIWSACPQLLNWPHDSTPRMTGPSPSGKGSVHGFVLNYYAPSVYAWLKAGRPDGGIPSGALIIKQMYQRQQRPARRGERLDHHRQKKDASLRRLVLGLR